jgi:serine/threonine-protein kinase
MLGDLRSRLAPVGRLEILDEVGAKALAYFDSLPPEAQNDDELMRRARALSQIGEVRLAKGDADGAIVALGESLALAVRGVERQPSRTEWLATLGATHFWIGYAHWNRNAWDDALTEFTATSSRIGPSGGTSWPRRRATSGPCTTRKGGSRMRSATSALR